MAKKLLLHVCCGPCATQVVKELKDDYDVMLYFYNPNIHPFGEYVRRLDNAKRVGDYLEVPMLEGEYSIDGWLESIKGLEHEPEGGRRCTVCFADRLAVTAKHAKDNDFDCFTTTMTISPHKDADTINKLGIALAKKHEVEWMHSDFKKKDGFKKSTEASKDMNLYRQKYCGCFYSVKAPK